MVASKINNERIGVNSARSEKNAHDLCIVCVEEGGDPSRKDAGESKTSFLIRYLMD